MKYILLALSLFAFACEAQQVINPYSFSSNFLTNGVYGDGSNDYLQVQNSDGSQYSHSVSGNWTLEYWMVPPTTLTDQEGTFTSNATSTTVNLVISNWFNYVSTTGFYNNIFEAWSSASSKGIQMPNPIGHKATNTFFNNYHIAIVCIDNGGGTYTYNYYVNGCIINRNYTAVASTQSSLRFQYLSDRGVGGRFSDGKFLGTRFYSRALSFSEIKQSYGEGKWSLPIGANCVFDFRLKNLTGNSWSDDNGSSLKITAVNFASVASNLYTPSYKTAQTRIVCAGSSITFGSGSTAGGLSTYPMQLYKGLNDNVTYEACFNLGIAGQTAQQIIDSFSTIDVLAYSSSASKNIYVVWDVPTNDLYYGASAATAYSRYVSLCTLARDAGYKVVSGTITPRSNSGTPGTFEADRQTYNALVRANWATFSDAFADVAANTTIGDAGDETNVTYYADLVHMTDAGYAIVAGIIKTAVLTL